MGRQLLDSVFKGWIWHDLNLHKLIEEVSGQIARLIKCWATPCLRIYLGPHCPEFRGNFNSQINLSANDSEKTLIKIG